MWAYDTVFYQFYTLGFCGAPKQNDGIITPRVKKISEWIPHLRSLNIGAVYFCPVFSSDSHGYDTRDYSRLDERLGTNGDFAEVCTDLHNAGIKVVLDGVFNHVGRGFWAFQDVLEKRWDSPYKDWFHIDFGGDSPYGDGFRYEGWEGHYELVRLNLSNEEVITHLFESIAGWVRDFGIDGLRLDVAYSLPEFFLKRLRAFCDGIKDDFFLLGEAIHGDYNRLIGGDKLHSVTNYQAYKGIWSSFNDLNLFEINYTLEQHFNGMYAGRHLLSFVDNHDVDRIASILKNPAHLPLAYALMFSMPGIPCVYYGSEWGVAGLKGNQSDDELRPELEEPEENELTRYISMLAEMHAQEPALRYGEYKKLLLTNRQLVFERSMPGISVIIAINAEDKAFEARFEAPDGFARDLVTGKGLSLRSGATLPPYSASFWGYSAETHMDENHEDDDTVPPAARADKRCVSGDRHAAQEKAEAADDDAAMCYKISVSGRVTIYERVEGAHRVIAAINAGNEPFKAVFDAHSEARDLLSGNIYALDGGFTLPPHSAFYFEL